MPSVLPFKRLTVLATLALATLVAGQNSTDSAAALTNPSATASGTTGADLTAPTSSVTATDTDTDTAAALTAASQTATQTTGAELSPAGTGVATTTTAAVAAGSGPPINTGPTTPVSTAALPSATVKLDNSIFTLSDKFEITDTPTTRDYWFDITAAAGAPDGSARQMYVVNGQFPGPLIEANTGDTINVHVTNWLDNGQAIHWHGINQKGTAYMDGVPGISQCPILYGQTFTYTFTVQEQYGTFWYHSHYANSMADGIYGPLIVHSPNEPMTRGQDYDEDRVLMVSDWLHDQSDVIVEQLRNGSYRGSPAPPQGDSIIINGVGQCNCSAPSAGISCYTPAPPEIHVPAYKTIRFRVISTSAHSFFRISIDGHSIEVIEADTTAVYGPTFHELPIGPGQRYSFLVTTDAGSEGDAFWLRVVLAIACLPGGVSQTGLAVFRYTGDGHASTQQPDSQAWSDLAAITDECLDLDQLQSVVPRVAKSAWGDASQTHFMNSQRGVFTDINGVTFAGFGFDNISYQNEINNPLLSVVESGRTIDAKLVRSVSYDGYGYGDILLNNLDPIQHPFHLHGNDFFILARGSGNITKDTYSSVGYDATNPLRRDTLWMAGTEWILIRITTDNPGVWAFHCHIGWHLSEGKLATVVVQPDLLQSYDQPSAWSALCDGTNPNELGPSKRARTMATLAETPASRRRTMREVKNRLLRRQGPRED